MSWKDHGVIFKVDHLSEWASSHAYVPTAIELPDRIRVFVAFWDRHRYGRLGYIDVDASDPTNILGYSKHPVVEDTRPPAFDNSGVTPLCIVPEADCLRLYYAGWNVHEDPNIRYQLFTGLLIGDKYGRNFKRYDTKPVISGRSSSEHIRTGGQVIKEAGGYRCYLATQAFLTHFPLS